MSKRAVTSSEVHDLIANRWSPRAFSGEPVMHKKLCAIFEAARWAPSAFNEQPWQFIVGFKPQDTYNSIYDSLVEFNKEWAKTAPILIVTLSKKNYAHNNKDNNYHSYDLGQAVAYLTIQAMKDGLFVHQMGGFDKDFLRKTLSIGDDYDIFTVMALGYKGNVNVLPDDIAKLETKPRERKDLKSLFYKELNTELF